MQYDIAEYIKEVNSEFVEAIGGSYVSVATGELITKAELKKIMERRVEEYNKRFMDNSRCESERNGLNVDQFISNKRSKKPKSKKVKDRFDGGDFNMVYRERIGDDTMVKLNATEKGIWYSLGELSTYPTNTVMIQGEIPTIEQISLYVGISDRQIRRHLKTLKEYNLIKEMQVGYKKAFVINPEYYATGKDLDIDTLKMFGLVECDDNKVDYYTNN